MEKLNKTMTKAVDRPVTVVQFGEGNFLRAFVDYMIDLANEKGLFNGSVVLVKPIEFGTLDRYKAQDCQYTVQLRGRVNGKEYVETRQITSVKDIVSPFDDYEEYISLAKLDTVRFVVSNTTEAGIVFNEKDQFEEKLNITFPAKLTQFLLTRYEHFNGAMDKGLVMLPVELIDDNGIELKRCVKKYITLWNLSEGFEKWLDEACIFTSTLVDRIVTGYPFDEVEEIWKTLGYRDEILVTAEPFALWVIESEKDISKEFPVDKALEGKEGMGVIFTDNQKPYKQRKVRILNGAHTSFVLASWLKGNDVVNQSMKDDVMREFMMKTIHEEVIPTLTLPEKDLKEFADAVVDRFNNPFIKHALLAISLNSVSKWKARCMPSFLGYLEKFGKLPEHLTFSIAALMAFYTGNEIREGVLIGHRDGQEYPIKDDADVLEFFKENSSKETSEFVHAVLSNTSFYGQDLTQIEGLSEKVTEYLDMIRTKGMEAALVHFFG
ncbi:MAG: tagaturonate reductase [Erysipelotrichaceae bacterium]|nr:tagaturonate reductase [Erysipelotrichaceae bacterium]